MLEMMEDDRAEREKIGKITRELSSLLDPNERHDNLLKVIETRNSNWFHVQVELHSYAQVDRAPQHRIDMSKASVLFIVGIQAVNTFSLTRRVVKVNIAQHERRASQALRHVEYSVALGTLQLRWTEAPILALLLREHVRVYAVFVHVN